MRVDPQNLLILEAPTKSLDKTMNGYHNTL